MIEASGLWVPIVLSITLVGLGFTLGWIVAAHWYERCYAELIVGTARYAPTKSSREDS